MGCSARRKNQSITAFDLLVLHENKAKYGIYRGKIFYKKYTVYKTQILLMISGSPYTHLPYSSYRSPSLRHILNFFHSQCSTVCDLVLYLSTASVFLFHYDHPVTAYIFFLIFLCVKSVTVR